MRHVLENHVSFSEVFKSGGTVIFLVTKEPRLVRYGRAVCHTKLALGRVSCARNISLIKLPSEIFWKLPWFTALVIHNGP